MSGFVEPKKVAIKRDRNERKKNKDRTIDLNILHVIPYKQITKEGYLLLEDNTYAEIYQFETHALNTINADEKAQLMTQLASFYRINIEDIKVISFKYPSDSEAQQLYWLHKYETATNPLQRAYQQDNIRRLQISAKTHKEMDHYVFVYADSKKGMSVVKDNIRQTSGGLLRKTPLSQKKKTNVLFQLNNMNTQYI
ncbi:hypothetical protein ETH98_08440 [Macrococcoides caseolyticum]|uniref:hypothetical protein n=1 Tax=Macrococcoides caseolyticum TaxID=69966 RepID=UPI001061DC4D|nr:hypothetical protein [Macrococcus caseolyticus]TDM28750.1 hypothetical protein ETH98_08440 [Macrococcus caseolyticus]VUC64684.1 Uncharacterised protein [Macrococcus caseolyticus]